MQTRLQGAPCLVAGGTIVLVLQDTLLDAPCHAIEEEGCSCHLWGGIVDIRNQTGVPEAVGMLALQQASLIRMKSFFKSLYSLLLGERSFMQRTRAA